MAPQWGAADAEIKIPSGENTELKRSPFKAWSKSVYSHTCYAYCKGFLSCLFLHFRSIHLHFFQNLSRFFPVLAVVRLQEIPSGWLYKNSSKNRAKLSLVFGHFCQCDNEWFVHDFYIQAQGGRQMCLSAVKLDHRGELLWDTPSWLSAWVSVFWAWRMDLNKGVPTLFAFCEKLLWKIFFIFKQGTCPWMAFAWNFFGIFMIFF